MEKQPAPTLDSVLAAVRGWFESNPTADFAPLVRLNVDHRRAGALVRAHRSFFAVHHIVYVKRRGTMGFKHLKRLTPSARRLLDRV